MKALITGRGTSGSWQIRGLQLGAALGVPAVPRAADVAGFDPVVLVKRPDPELLQRLHAARSRIVWDVVDAWPQPEGNAWTRDQAMAWLRQTVAQIQPAAIVAATEAMARDCGEFGVPVLALPHHARPGQALNPLRETVRHVGYEGSERHLGSWRGFLEAECGRRGWRFVINPPRLADVDIVVALRELDGYPARYWKSNVKLANAQASGTPIVCHPESGYRETASGGEVVVTDPGGVRYAFDTLAHVEARRLLAARMLQAAPTLDAIAARYGAWLGTL